MESYENNLNGQLPPGLNGSGLANLGKGGHMRTWHPRNIKKRDSFDKQETVYRSLSEETQTINDVPRPESRSNVNSAAACEDSESRAALECLPAASITRQSSERPERHGGGEGRRQLDIYIYIYTEREREKASWIGQESKIWSKFIQKMPNFKHVFLTCSWARHSNNFIG